MRGASMGSRNGGHRCHVQDGMDGAERLKIALDESRMLVLGSQVLLGFQFRSVFQDAFEQLPARTKLWDGLALLLMVVVVGLLIAPAIHHRVVENGEATQRMLRAVTIVMGMALVPFALSLGINVFLALQRVTTIPWPSLFGVAATATALVFWFGIEWLAVARKGGKDVKMQNEHVPLAKKIDQLLTEARVILPGAQALLGFQLSVVLTEAFDKLPSSSKSAHAAALGSVALSTILLMAPAAYHRIVYAGEASEDFLRLGSRFILAATAALALGLANDVYVVMAKIAGSVQVGIASAAFSLAILIGLWHVSPAAIRVYRARCA